MLYVPRVHSVCDFFSVFFFFKQKTAYEMRISYWSSDVCSSDLLQDLPHVDIMKPITKFASSVVSTERVADMVSMAFRECYLGAPGPSYLAIGRGSCRERVCQ